MPLARLTRLAPLLFLAFAPALVPGCEAEPPGPGSEALGKAQAELNKAERTARYEKIKGAAAARGINNTAFLLAGIAYAETSLAHCWSEATWACKGPNSADCGGGPVIAGAGDGACSLQQGGLGMFQFDAGTFTDTLNKYGNNVLAIDGNVDHAINYVINMVKISSYTTNAETDAKSLAWVANFDINNGTLRDQWIKTVTHYYNGCKPSYSCWDQRYKHYNDSLQYVIDDTGLDFWGTAPVAGPDWKATFVSQGFPYASQPFELPPGATKDGYIELRNDGQAPWKPGEVFLGTTEPRDGDSPLAAPGWVSGHRAATVEKETPPGQSGRFNFAVKAPAAPGDYPQFFNLVREGVAWFSDGGQGGPPDNLLQVRVTVVAAPCPAGVGADWVCQGDARVRCEPSTGAVSSEPCPDGCQGPPGAAQCAPPPAGQGGSGGSGQGGSPGNGGSAQAGSSSAGKGSSPGSGGTGSGATAGQPAAGSNSGSGSSAGTSGKAGSSGKSARGGGSSVTTENLEGSSDDGCGCSTPGQRPAAPAGALAALALAALASRRRRLPPAPPARPPSRAPPARPSRAPRPLPPAPRALSLPRPRPLPLFSLVKSPEVGPAPTGWGPEGVRTLPAPHR